MQKRLKRVVDFNSISYTKKKELVSNGIKLSNVSGQAGKKVLYTKKNKTILVPADVSSARQQEESSRALADSLDDSNLYFHT